MTGLREDPRWPASSLAVKMLNSPEVEFDEALEALAVLRTTQCDLAGRASIFQAIITAGLTLSQNEDYYWEASEVIAALSLHGSMQAFSDYLTSRETESNRQEVGRAIIYQAFGPLGLLNREEVNETQAIWALGQISKAMIRSMINAAVAVGSSVLDRQIAEVVMARSLVGEFYDLWQQEYNIDRRDKMQDIIDLDLFPSPPMVAT